MQLSQALLDGLLASLVDVGGLLEEPTVRLCATMPEGGISTDIEDYPPVTIPGYADVPDVVFTVGVDSQGNPVLHSPVLEFLPDGDTALPQAIAGVCIYQPGTPDVVVAAAAAGTPVVVSYENQPYHASVMIGLESMSGLDPEIWAS